MPLFADIPPAMEERVICSIASAIKYEIPANIVLAVAAQEGGKPGQWKKNKNGTHDVGPMQFNTDYLDSLAKYGITGADVEKAGCYPYDLAAWRLRGHILNDKGDLWKRVANYHSRTPKYNGTYRTLIMQRAMKWADWLDANFNTQKVSQSDATYRSSPDSKITNSKKTEITSRIVSPEAASNGLQTYVPRRLITSSEK